MVIYTFNRKFYLSLSKNRRPPFRHAKDNRFSIEILFLNRIQGPCSSAYIVLCIARLFKGRTMEGLKIAPVVHRFKDIITEICPFQTIRPTTTGYKHKAYPYKDEPDIWTYITVLISWVNLFYICSCIHQLLLYPFFIDISNQSIYPHVIIHSVVVYLDPTQVFFAKANSIYRYIKPPSSL